MLSRTDIEDTQLLDRPARVLDYFRLDCPKLRERECNSRVDVRSIVVVIETPQLTQRPAKVRRGAVGAQSFALRHAGVRRSST
jgi:hypothetical protein